MERTLHSGLTCPIAQRHLVIGTDQSCAAGTDHFPNLPLIFSSFLAFLTLPRSFLPCVIPPRRRAPFLV